MSGGDGAARPAHLALAHAAVIAPFGAAASTLGAVAHDLSRGVSYSGQLSYVWAEWVVMTALLGCFVLVEEVARGRSRPRALVMFVMFALFHGLLLDAVLSALREYVLGWTTHRAGNWALLDVWASAVDTLKYLWSRGNLRAPLLLTSVPLLALGLARGVLRLPGWAQPLVAVAAAFAGGALFGVALSSAAGYPREAWGGVIASCAVLHASSWAAIPFGLRVGDRVAPWVIARLAADIATDRSSA